MCAGDGQKETARSGENKLSCTKQLNSAGRIFSVLFILCRCGIGSILNAPRAARGANKHVFRRKTKITGDAKIKAERRGGEGLYRLGIAAREGPSI